MALNPLGAINSVALALGRFESLTEMLDYALEKVLEAVQTEAGSVYLLDEARGELTVAVSRGLSAEAARDFDHLPLGEGLSGRVAVDGIPIVIRNLKDDPRLTRMMARAEGFCAFASVPLRSNFKTYGTLNIHTRAARDFSDEDLQLLTSMGAQIGLSVANARLYWDLQASERRFRSVVENAEDLIYLTDPDGRLVYANTAFERLLGYQPERLQAARLPLLDLVHPDDTSRMTSLLNEMLAGRTLRALEFRLKSRDGGSARIVSQTNVPLRNDAGAVTGMQCIAQDITARRQMETHIARAERLADLGRMAAGLAHEMRNPLGAIVNSINVLRRPGAAADSRLLGIVTEEVDRLEAILKEFLLFARPPARFSVPCDVKELINSTVVLFSLRDKTSPGPAIRVQVSTTVSPVNADPNQMRQVLWNLLSNAADAMGGAGHIDVGAVDDPGNGVVRITVTDDGPGLTDADAVFEPFYTTKPQGTGLGLAVVARIVRDHDGFVTAENVPSRGACFTIALPRLPAVA